MHIQICCHDVCKNPSSKVFFSFLTRKFITRPAHRHGWPDDPILSIGHFFAPNVHFVIIMFKIGKIFNRFHLETPKFFIEWQHHIGANSKWESNYVGHDDL